MTAFGTASALPLLALALLGVRGTADEPSTRPNVVLFVIDDVADSDYDTIRTPTFDALAERGVRFRRAYAHSWCAPSRDALLFAAWNGLERGRDCEAPGPWTRPDDTLTLGKLFQRGGYTTAFFGKWHMGTTHGGGWRNAAAIRGFDRVLCGMTVDVCEAPPDRTRPHPDERVESRPPWGRLDDGELSWEVRDRSEALREAIRDWWLATEGPKFAHVNFRAAHAPFRRPDDELLPEWARALSARTPRQKFELEVIGIEHVVSELLPVLGDDTIVVFTSDNGTPGSNERKKSAARPDQKAARTKSSCYEDGVRVPLVVVLPDGPRGVVVDQPVHLVDLLPTFADVLDIPLEEAVDGRSFAPAWTGEALERDWVYVHDGADGQRAIIGRSWKLLERKTGDRALFDLEHDPREEAPLAPEGAWAERFGKILDALAAAPDRPGGFAEQER